MSPAPVYCLVISLRSDYCRASAAFSRCGNRSALSGSECAIIVVCNTITYSTITSCSAPLPHQLLTIWGHLEAPGWSCSHARSSWFHPSLPRMQTDCHVPRPHTVPTGHCPVAASWPYLCLRVRRRLTRAFQAPKKCASSLVRLWHTVCSLIASPVPASAYLEQRRPSRQTERKSYSYRCTLVRTAWMKEAARKEQGDRWSEPNGGEGEGGREERE